MKKRVTRVMALVMALILFLGEMPALSVRAQETSDVSVPSETDGAPVLEPIEPKPKDATPNDPSGEDENILVAGHDYELSEGRNEFVIHADSATDLGMYELICDDSEAVSISSSASSSDLSYASYSNLILINVKSEGDYNIVFTSDYDGETVHCSNVYKIVDYEPLNLNESFYEEWDSEYFDYAIKLIYENGSEVVERGYDDYSEAKWYCLRYLANYSLIKNSTTEKPGEVVSGWKISADWCDKVGFYEVDYYSVEDAIEGVLSVDNPVSLIGKKKHVYLNNTDYNYVKLVIDNTGYYRIISDRNSWNISSILSADFQDDYAVTNDNGDNGFSIYPIKLDAGTYYFQCYSVEPYTLELQEDVAVTSMEIVSGPKADSYIKLYNSVWSYACYYSGLEVKLSYSDGSTENVIYGSYKWLEKGLDARMQDGNIYVSHPTLNGTTILEDYFEEVDGKDIATPLTVDGASVLVEDNSLVVGGRTIYELGNIFSLNIEEAGKYTFTAYRDESYDEDKQLIIQEGVNGSSHSTYGRNIEYSIDLEEGYYCFYINCNEDINFFVKASSSELENVHVNTNLLRTVYLANMEYCSPDGLVINAEYDGDEISITPYDDKWYSFNFSDYLVDEDGERVSGKPTEGDYNLVIKSPAIDEDIIIPVSFASIDNLVQYTLSVNNNVSIDDNCLGIDEYNCYYYDGQYLKIDINENGTYGFLFTGDDEDTSFDCSIFGEDGIEIYSSFWEGMPEEGVYKTIYLDAKTLYMRVGSNKEIELSLKKANGVADISVLKGPNRSVFYCGLDSDTYKILNGAEFELTLDDGSKTVVSYDDDNWSRYGLKANDGYNKKTPGNKKITVSIPSGKKVDITVSYTTKDNIVNSLEVGEEYHGKANTLHDSYADVCWFKLQVPTTKSYVFKLISDYYNFYGLNSFELYSDSGYEDEIVGSIKLSSAENYYVYVSSDYDYKLLVDYDKYITDIVGVVDDKGNEPFYIENFDFCVDDIYVKTILEDASERILSVYDGNKLSVSLFDSEDNELEDALYDSEAYEFTAGDYYLMVSTRFTSNGQKLSKRLPFTIHSTSEVDAQTVGEPIERKGGEEYTYLYVPESGLYLFDTSECPSDYTSSDIALKDSNGEYTIYEHGMDSYRIYSLNQGYYALRALEGMSYYDSDFTIITKKMPEIVSFDWSEAYKKYIKERVSSYEGFKDLYYKISIDAIFSDGSKKTIGSSIEWEDGIPYGFYTFFSKEFTDDEGYYRSTSNVHAVGKYKIKVTARNNKSLSKSVSFEVVKDVDYYDNYITPQQSNRLVDGMGMLKINESGFYYFACDDDLNDVLYSVSVYSLTDGNAYEFYSGPGYTGTRLNTKVSEYIYKSEKASPLRSVYLEAGDYFLMCGAKNAEIKILKQKSIKSIDVKDIAATVYKEIGYYAYMPIPLEVTYVDGSKETVETNLIEMCDCNFGPNWILDNIEITIENDSIADRSWLNANGRTEISGDAKIYFNTLDTNYYWVIKDKVSNTTKRINFVVDTINNYDKVITPGGGKVLIEYDENLGKALLMVDIPETAEYSFSFSHPYTDSLYLDGYDLTDITTKETLYRKTYTGKKTEDNEYIWHACFENTSDHKLKKGKYCFDLSAYYNTDMTYYYVSVEKVSEIKSLSDIQSPTGVMKNVFLEGDRESALYPWITAIVERADGSKKREQLRAASTTGLYGGNADGYMNLEIKKKDGSSPTYKEIDDWDLFTGEPVSGKVKTLPAGEYIWEISSNSGKLLASIPFVVLKPSDALNYQSYDVVGITDKKLTSSCDAAWCKVVIAEGEKYKIEVPTYTWGYTVLEIITYNKATSKVEHNKYFRPANKVTDDIILNPGTYLIRGSLYSTKIVDISGSIPDAPVLSTVKQEGKNVKITWNESARATGYEIFVSKAGGSFTSIAKITDGSTEYTDATTKTHGSKYTYKVVAFNAQGSSPGSNTKAITYVGEVKAPAISSITNSSSGYTITWGKVANAGGYEIFVSVDGGEYASLAKITSAATVSYVDKTRIPGKVYKYKVRAYNSIFTGAFSAEKTAPKLLATPAISKLENSAGGVTITWGKVKDATGYIVQRKVGSGKYTTVATIKSGSTVKYLDKTASSGNKYTYTVTATAGSNKSAASKEASIIFLGVAKFSSTSGNCEKVVLKWTAVSGADGYYIYRKKGSEAYALYTTISKGTTVTYTDTHVDKGLSYAYKIVTKKGNVKAAESAAVSVKVTGHTYTKTITPATSAKDGKIVNACKNCTKKVSEAIPAAKKIGIAFTSADYTGKDIKPAITICDVKGNAINKAYYTITYSGCKAVGTATAKITFKGNYTGTVTKTYKILPEKTKITKLAPASKSFTATVAAGKGAEGYEIQYSTTSTFKSVNKQMLKATVKSVPYKKLKSKTMYYVRVRSYKNVTENGKTVVYYSDWSPTLSVKTK